MPAAATKHKAKTSAPPGLPASVPLVNYEDQLLSRADTARWLGVTVDCMSVWSRQKPPRGPRALRCGQFRVRYKIGEILRWLDSQADAPEVPRKRQRLNTEQSTTVRKTA